MRWNQKVWVIFWAFATYNWYDFQSVPVLYFNLRLFNCETETVRCNILSGQSKKYCSNLCKSKSLWLSHFSPSTIYFLNSWKSQVGTVQTLSSSWWGRDLSSLHLSLASLPRCLQVPWQGREETVETFPVICFDWKCHLWFLFTVHHTEEARKCLVITSCPCCVGLMMHVPWYANEISD